jgi:hypothetical protein
LPGNNGGWPGLLVGVGPLAFAEVTDFEIGGARAGREGLFCLRGSAGLGLRMIRGWPPFGVGVRPFEGGPAGEALMAAAGGRPEVDG